MIAALGILLVLGFQRIGVGSRLAYILPGAVIWAGMLITGAHPTLAGVVLGLLTPVRSDPHARAPGGDGVSRCRGTAKPRCRHRRRMRIAWRDRCGSFALASREMLPPVVRVQTALHPWVAYGIMPLFALANAGVSLGGC